MRILAALGAVFLLSGCASNPSISKKYSYDSNKRHIVQYDENNYYYRPDYAWSHRLDASTANINNVASSELLNCKENDIWFMSLNDREEEGGIRYRYFISLAKSQLMDMEDNATYIPRRDSKEFKDLIAMDTKMVRQGLIGCSERMSKKQISKIKIK